MELLGVLVPVLAAGGWLWWLYQADRLEREPWPLVFKTFGFGAAAGGLGLIGLIVALLVLPEDIGYSGGILLLVPVHVLAMTAVIAGLPFRNAAWNEPFDGLVYGGATGIGYGLVFTLSALLEGPGAGFRSAIFAIPTFMIAGLIIGHYLSRSRFGQPRWPVIRWIQALLFATLALGLIEFARALGGTVMGLANPVASAFVYGANTLGWIMAMWAMDQKHRLSPFNPNRRLRLTESGCPTCATATVAGAGFCHGCGHRLAPWKEELPG